MPSPSTDTVQAMLTACTDHYERLIAGSCAEDVALDRTWDAFLCAYMESSGHCVDPRDRLFESKLRTLRKKG